VGVRGLRRFGVRAWKYNTVVVASTWKTISIVLSLNTIPPYLRKNTSKRAVRPQKPRIGADIFPLRTRYPPHSLLIAVLFTRVENAESDSWQVRRRRVRTRAVQVARGYLYVHRADFIRSGMRRKPRRRIQSMKPGHVGNRKRIRCSKRKPRRKSAGKRSKSA
jgi:hypothetical protein